MFVEVLAPALLGITLDNTTDDPENVRYVLLLACHCVIFEVRVGGTGEDCHRYPNLQWGGELLDMLRHDGRAGEKTTRTSLLIFSAVCLPSTSIAYCRAPSPIRYLGGRHDGKYRADKWDQKIERDTAM